MIAELIGMKLYLRKSHLLNFQALVCFWNENGQRRAGLYTFSGGRFTGGENTSFGFVSFSIAPTGSGWTVFAFLGFSSLLDLHQNRLAEETRVRSQDETKRFSFFWFCFCSPFVGGRIECRHNNSALPCTRSSCISRQPFLAVQPFKWRRESSTGVRRDQPFPEP